MDEKTLEEAAAMAQSGLILIATSGEDGVPHLAAAGRMVMRGRDNIVLEEWFCPGTVANARPGRPVSVVVWDPANDTGHQLIGRVIDIEESTMMDGYSPAEEEGRRFPQVKRRLVIIVERALSFTKAPHSDMEE